MKSKYDSSAFSWSDSQQSIYLQSHPFASLMANFSPAQLACCLPESVISRESQAMVGTAINKLPANTFDRATAHVISQICQLIY